MKILITEQQLIYLMENEKDITDLIETFFLSYRYPKFVVYFEVNKTKFGYIVEFYVDEKNFNKLEFKELYNLFHEIKDDFFQMIPYKITLNFSYSAFID